MKKENNNITVSLYLVILAFFILLCSFSDFDDERAYQVSQSIKNQFFKYDNNYNKVKYYNVSSLSPDFRKLYKILLDISNNNTNNIEIIDDSLTLTIPISDLYKNDTTVEVYSRYEKHFNEIVEIIKKNKFVKDYIYKISYCINVQESNYIINMKRAESFLIKMLNAKLDNKNIAIGVSQENLPTVKLSFGIEKV